MERTAKSDKLLVLGVDGMDPRFSKRMLREGKMPNLQKLIDRGSCRADLTMLGAHPNVTPPMWTTLATGAYPMTHGITGFSLNGEEITTSVYGLDSRLCQAEQIWNVFAENGKKTLVVNWPGGSWPPSSDSENLFVIDGTSPGSIGMGVNQLDNEFIVVASEQLNQVNLLLTHQV